MALPVVGSPSAGHQGPAFGGGIYPHRERRGETGTRDEALAAGVLLKPAISFRS
jgi:hypothetical protein